MSSESQANVLSYNHEQAIKEFVYLLPAFTIVILLLLNDPSLDLFSPSSHIRLRALKVQLGISHLEDVPANERQEEINQIIHSLGEKSTFLRTHLQDHVKFRSLFGLSVAEFADLFNDIEHELITHGHENKHVIIGRPPALAPVEQLAAWLLFMRGSQLPLIASHFKTFQLENLRKCIHRVV